MRMGKKAIVTGGSGFIGGRLISELLDNGYEVTAVIRGDNVELPFPEEKVTIVRKDINDITSDDFTSEDGYDVFFNLAWAGVSDPLKNDVELQIGNITGSIHAIETAKKTGCRLFISSGTVAEYSYSDSVTDVDARQTPNDMYGAAKTSVHYFLEVRARQLAQPFVWVVLPSTYGERRRNDNIITYTIKTLLGRGKPIYGKLEQMWDFLYVDDVSRALRLVGEAGHPGKVYGIGSGVHKPLKEYIERIRDIIDPSLPLGIGDRPEMTGKTICACINIDDLQKDTGFTPKFTFDEGIERTIKWIMDTEGTS